MEYRYDSWAGTTVEVGIYVDVWRFTTTAAGGKSAMTIGHSLKEIPELFAEC